MNPYGKRLKELRKEQGLTMEQLAAATGCSQGLISQWERDVSKPSYDWLIAMAKYFNVTVGYMAGVEE